MIEAVIFDLDDTFSLTEAVCFEIGNAALEQMGQPAVTRKAHLETWEKRLPEAVALRSPGIDTTTFMALYERLLAKYIESGDIDTVPNENYKALDQLTRRGKRLMVLTSRAHHRVKHLLQPEHPLASKVESFHYRDNTRFRKPNPRVFDELLYSANVRPEQCVYVGDSYYDAKAAKQAGLYFIASLESGLRKRKDFTDVAVDAFIERFPEVVGAVQRLDKAA